MTVLKEILEWSIDRPAWQRDALRRLVLNGDLSDEDIKELTDISKSGYGLAEQCGIEPLTKDHVPEKTTGQGPVSLLSIFHHHGVNALAEDQTLKFVPTLTVVYGDNAAGKTGYIRILKSACRARGQETILGNIISGATPLSPVVSIKYQVGTEPDPREWVGTGEDEFISRVSVFDTQCAAVYLTEKTDVAFRPFGLDLFDKLVKACKAVRVNLENEQRSITLTGLTPIKAQVPEGTAAARFLSSISSLTKPEAVQAFTNLSPEEVARLNLLEKSLLDLQTNDPEGLIRQLTIRAGRVRALARHLRNVEAALFAEPVRAVFEARTEDRRKSEEAKRLREATISKGMLAGTGSETWASLWEAARRFSQLQAYPGQIFPVVDNGAHCVLCQQDLDQQAGARLKKFEAFIVSTTERELRQTKDKLAQLRKTFTDLRTSSETIEEDLKEIRVEHDAAGKKIIEALSNNEKRRKAIVIALNEEKDLAADCPSLVSVSSEADALSEEIEKRINTLQSGATDETRKPMIAELQELRARKVLASHEQTIVDEIERRRKFAAYGLCINETRTQAITQKSTAVTKAVVSQRLKESFKNELLNLDFRHVDVELKEVGGADGVLYHKLILSRAPGVDLPRVVSEGEQRCLSIAAFFAELSTADDPSGIVFDDPVSSLDYRWREGVAQRLVQEAKTRQVIVFTHDVVFLLLLKQYAKDLAVEQLDQHVQQLPKGAGVCIEELPWVAMPVNKKIGHLKNSRQAAEKLWRDGHQALYEKEAQFLYGLLRAAWERALEEVLLGGIIERYRPGIQTQQIHKIGDICEEDCRVVEAAMTKCSKWLPGHDQAAAARAPIPEPAELKSDIEALEDWVAIIRKRRK